MPAVTDWWTPWLGPLAVPECSRATRRGWLIWARMLSAFAAGAVAIVLLGSWWVALRFDPTHQPSYELRFALMILEGLVVVFAMVMTPAMLAGSLAGEKERGSIGLLLTTRVSSADIVLGRLAGRLSQVAIIELAAVPPLLLITCLAGFGWAATLTLLALPMGLALGGGGIALAASAMSRRGRDALLFVYLVEILLLLSPLVAPFGLPWLAVLTPFETIKPLAWGEITGPALATAGAWAMLGGWGLVVASWRLRPSCLAEGDDARSRKRARRRAWVPPMDDERPMLWKELYIERVGTLGRAGRWIGGFLVLLLAGGSLGLGSCVAWGYFSPSEGSAAWSDWAVNQSSLYYGTSAMFIGVLIQWAIGLRAAVTISSERERGTWDALLTSPLLGTEIVRGKLWGSLWALRWLVGSALLAWTITFAIGGMFWPEYAEQLVGLVVVGTFMSAIGVRTSLRSPTATRAMGITIAFWLGACVLAYAIAMVICVAVMFVCVLGWLYAASAGLTTFNTRPWFPMTFRLGWDLLFYAQFVIGALLVLVETRYRFDRVAGRMTGGAAAVAIDRLIHGVPMAPVRLVAKGKAAIPELDEVAG